jgi:23S rRNA (guanosine2251-2'-O)-methyltransferase
VRELLAARTRRTRDVWLSDSVDDEHPLIVEIIDLAEEERVPIRRVPRGKLDAEAQTEAPQGVLAHADPLREHDLEELIAGRGAESRKPFLLVLDGVTDPQNVGALLRTADASGVTGVVLPRHRAAHVTPAVTKAAAGAVEHVPMTVVAGIPAALAVLKERGVWTVGLDAESGRSIFDLPVATEPLALVLGAEGPGLSRLARQRCDVVAAIPLSGHIPSLNVSAAGAVACFEVLRRRLSDR